jgi:hypothetical protein
MDQVSGTLYTGFQDINFARGGNIQTGTLVEQGIDEIRISIGLQCIVKFGPGQCGFQRSILLRYLITIQ